jgi:uncharacterized membrane protein
VQNEYQQLSQVAKGLLIGFGLALAAIKVSVWVLPVAGVAYLVHVWRQVGRDRAAYDASIAHAKAQSAMFESLAWRRSIGRLTAAEEQNLRDTTAEPRSAGVGIPLS